MLDGRRVLVTGGAGLIGSTIVDLLCAEPVECIRVLDVFDRGRHENLAPALALRPVEVIEGDIRDRDQVAEAMQGIDLVFHEAAIRITQCAEDPRLALEVMVDGAFNVVEAAARNAGTRVILASSASIYGQAETFPTREDHHPYGDRTFYGAAKSFNEAMLRSFNEMHGLDYVALRYFNVYGPRMDTFGVYTEVLIRWMERIDAGEPPLILGDGTQTMDFVYVEDVARANLCAAAAPVSDAVFNIGSGTETSLRELADALLVAMGSVLVPEHGPERAVNNVQRRLADVARAREQLGFEARVGLDDGLRRLVAWWRGARAEAGLHPPTRP